MSIIKKYNGKLCCNILHDTTTSLYKNNEPQWTHMWEHKLEFPPSTFKLHYLGIILISQQKRKTNSFTLIHRHTYNCRQSASIQFKLHLKRSHIPNTHVLLYFQIKYHHWCVCYMRYIQNSNAKTNEKSIIFNNVSCHAVPSQFCTQE